MSTVFLYGMYILYRIHFLFFADGSVFWATFHRECGSSRIFINKKVLPAVQEWTRCIATTSTALPSGHRAIWWTRAPCIVPSTKLRCFRSSVFHDMCVQRPKPDRPWTLVWKRKHSWPWTWILCWTNTHRISYIYHISWCQAMMTVATWCLVVLGGGVL